MAHELVEEVLDHCPAGLDAAARLVLICIAEECRKAPNGVVVRVRDIATAELLRRTGLKERALRYAIERLEDAGLQVRVALGRDRQDRPMYALIGRVCRWVLPPLPAPAGCPCTRCTQAAAQCLPQTEEAADIRQAAPHIRQAATGGMAAGTTVPPLPSIPFPYADGVIVDREAALAHIRAVTGSARRTQPEPP